MIHIIFSSILKGVLRFFLTTAKIRYELYKENQ